MNKKGSITISIIALVLVVLVILVYLGNTFNQGCKNNSECGDDSYCGADNECHQYPPQVIVKENNYIPAAIIFGVSIITAALIYKKKQNDESH
ncbi:hypothetical protein HYT52_01850 [Candidatus Woesearchaeota archaeon]|nr:hypothetical protein [Candidatus Woesearchaeota archaeon]